MFALVFGYAQKEDGSIDEQTKERCFKGVLLYNKGAVSGIYLTVSAEKAGKAMANEMANFIHILGVPKRNIHIRRQGGNTAGEMDVFLADLLEKIGTTRGIFFVSTWYHMPRIAWLAWRRIPWRNFSFSVSWKHAHFKGDFLVEFLKMANALIRPIRSAKVLPNPLI